MLITLVRVIIKDLSQLAEASFTLRKLSVGRRYVSPFICPSSTAHWASWKSVFRIGFVGLAKKKNFFFGCTLYGFWDLSSLTRD